MGTVMGQQAIAESVMMDIPQARQTIQGLTRYGSHAKQNIETIADADTAVSACALTLNFIGNVQSFVESVDLSGLCEHEILNSGRAFLGHAETQAITAMSTEHEVNAIKGHLYMAVAIAERLIRTMHSDIVIRT